MLANNLVYFLSVVCKRMSTWLAFSCCLHCQLSKLRARGTTAKFNKCSSKKYNNLHHKIKILPRFGLIINLLCQTKSSRKIMPLSFCSKIKNCQKQLTDSFVIQRRLHHEVALGISPRLFDRRAVSRGSKLCIEKPSDWLEA